MDETNMTLQDFIEFADIYPYTQDHYVMEKMFMELDLISMHLESYEFLLNEDNVTLGQLSVMMVEAGINDQSYITEQLFMEQGFNIFNGIQKMFKMIGKAIMAVCRKVRDAFSGGNKRIEALEKKNQEQAKLLEDIKLLNDISGAGKNAREMSSDLEYALERTRGQFSNIVDHVDKHVGGGGPKAIPVVGDGGDNSLKVIIDTVSKISGKDVPQSATALYLTFLQKEYDVEGIAFIETLETLPERISPIIDLSKGMDDITSIAYNSAKKLDTYGRDVGEKARKVHRDLEKSLQTTKRYKISETTLQKKLDTSVKLNEVFSDLADWTDIGVVNKNNPLADVLGHLFTNDSKQGVAYHDVSNQIKRDIKADPDMKLKLPRLNMGSARDAGKATYDKTKFRYWVTSYLKIINELAVSLQTATAETTKILSEHMALRSEIIKAHTEITKDIDTIIEETKKVA